MSAMSAAVQQAGYPQPVLTQQERRLQWIVHLWRDAHRADTERAWERLCDFCYGAVQASTDSMYAADHEAFDTLWDVSTQHRLDAAEQESAHA